MKKMAAGILSALLITVVGVLGLASPASAHTGNLYVEYECNTATGQYDGTAYVDVSNTDLVGQTYWAEGTTTFAGTPTSTTNPIALTNGPVQSNGSQTITLGAVASLPGTTTTSPWVYAFTTWTDNFTEGRDGGNNTLAGDCVKDNEIAKVDWGLNPPTCTVGQTLTVGDNNLTGAVWTPEALAKNGTAGPAEFDLVATLLPGYEWADGVNGTFHVVLIGPDKSLCPVNQTCPTHSNNGMATELNMNGWSEFASKPGGSFSWVSNGLALNNADGNSKVSWSRSAAGGSLATVGTIGVNWTNTGGAIMASGPGLNIFVTFGPGLTGILVGEPNVYGQDWWLTDSSNAAIVGPQTGGGFGSARHGTITEWLSLYPGATWDPYFAFAFGTGGPASGVLGSIDGPDCVTDTFGQSPQPPHEYYKTIEKSDVDCTADSRTITIYFWKITYSWNGTGWVPNAPVQYKDPYVFDRPLYPGEVEDNCEIEDTPAASLTDQCGLDNYTLTLSTPGANWGWSEPVVDGDTLTVTAVPVGVWFFGKDVQTEFEFTLDNADCPLIPPALALTGSDGGINWIIGASLLILTGAALAVAATRRERRA